MSAHTGDKHFLCQHAADPSTQGELDIGSPAGSFVAEGRLPLFDEGPHTLLAVLGGEGGMKEPPLEAYPLGQRRLPGAEALTATNLSALFASEAAVAATAAAGG